MHWFRSKPFRWSLKTNRIIRNGDEKDNNEQFDLPYIFNSITDHRKGNLKRPTKTPSSKMELYLMHSRKYFEWTLVSTCSSNILRSVLLDTSFHY